MASLIESSADAPARSAAAELARAHAQSNARALEVMQPALAGFARTEGDVEFVFGRDGALTARVDGQWISDCSLPRRTAEYLLRKLEMRGSVGCHLHPTHAQQVRVVLDRLDPHQALVAVVEDEAVFRWMLHCLDFAADIERGRLWFAVGADWAQRLRELLETRQGLPVPDQFIRTRLSDPQRVQQAIEGIRPLLQQEKLRRAEEAGRLRRRWDERTSSGSARWCVLAGSMFRLWQGAAARLWAQLGTEPQRFVRYDPDQPANASVLALLQAAIECDGIIAADLGRANFPELLPAEMPWVTWVTRGRIPSASQAGAGDRLLVADPAWLPAARRAGWDEQRVGVALWPELTPQRGSGGSRASGRAALIADTRPIDLEPEMELSSHRLLWEQIAHELSENPFVVAKSGGEGDYLARRREQMDISEIGFDAARFVSDLIRPAYQQSLARHLIDRGWLVDLWGEGWSGLAGLDAYARGPVDDFDVFLAVVEQAEALVHPEIDTSFRHEIDSLGHPVLRPTALTTAGHRALGDKVGVPASDGHPILSHQCLCVLDK